MTMSDDCSPDDPPWFQEQEPEPDLTDEEWAKLRKEEDAPLRWSVKQVERVLEEQTERCAEIMSDLESLGVRASDGGLQLLPEIDFSSLDERSARIATLAFEFGMVTTRLFHYDNRLRELKRAARGGELGGAATVGQGKATSRRTHTAFAELLENDLAASDLSLVQLSKRLEKSLKTFGRGYSAGNIRTTLRALSTVVDELAGGPKIPTSPMDARIRAIVALAGDAPGITFNTVRYFLYKLR
jgi:hypothetical protein